VTQSLSHGSCLLWGPGRTGVNEEGRNGDFVIGVSRPRITRRLELAWGSCDDGAIWHLVFFGPVVGWDGWVAPSILYSTLIFISAAQSLSPMSLQGAERLESSQFLWGRSYGSWVSHSIQSLQGRANCLESSKYLEARTQVHGQVPNPLLLRAVINPLIYLYLHNEQLTANVVHVHLGWKQTGRH
jgi:hypothetical protein